MCAVDISSTRRMSNRAGSAALAAGATAVAPAPIAGAAGSVAVMRPSASPMSRLAALYVVGPDGLAGSPREPVSRPLDMLGAASLCWQRQPGGRHQALR